MGHIPESRSDAGAPVRPLLYHGAMDRFLTRYVLPPLARRVQLEALSANQRALLLLREGGKHADLADAVAAGSSCWWLLRPALSKGRWKAVRRSLARQRTLLEQSPLRRSKLARTLERQSAWLGELASAPVPADRIMLDRFARAYRKAWREARRASASTRMSGRLRRLVICEELLLAQPGPITGEPMPGASARRRWLERVEHPAQARRADGGTSERRGRGRRELVSRAFDVSPEAYRAGLPGVIRSRNWPQPRPLAVLGGQQEETCA